MAFNLTNFQFGRGTTSAYAQGQGITTAIHTYKTAVDNLATVTSGGYLPPYIGGDAEEFFIDDLILIAATDGLALVRVTGVNPVTVTSSALIGGITLGAPIAPVDNNALQFIAGVLKAQFADGTHPGIVSTTSQGFGGIKNFNAGANIFAPGLGVDVINTLINGGTLDLGPSLTGLIKTTPVLQAVAGVAFVNNLAVNTLVNFSSQTIAATWSGAYTTPQGSSIDIQRVNNLAYLTIRTVPTAAQTNATILQTGGIIPVGLRPTGGTVTGTIRVLDNATFKVGMFLINGSGGIEVYTDMNLANFAGAGSAAIQTATISYPVV